MQYNLDSDSDEEEEAAPSSKSQQPHGDQEDTNQSSYLSDLEEIKHLTMDLISHDKDARKERNQSFLLKMLNLDEPTITPKMVDFLLQEGVCECLLEFITKIGNGPRPTKDSGKNEHMRIAYR
jgi:hypothetical protein